MKNLITILSVNWNAYDFAQLLLESIGIFSLCSHEVIIVDNSSSYKPLTYPKLNHIQLHENVGHGEGLNLGFIQVQTPYTMIVDIDCHFLRRGWEIELLETAKDFPIIAGKGVPQKPIRPACMFLDTQLAKKYDWRPTPGYQGCRITPDGFDVAIKAYHQMVKEGVPMSLLSSTKNNYGTLNGEDWLLNEKPFLYHHWHGSSLELETRKKDFPGIDLIKDKERLFSQIPWRQL